MDSMFYLIFEQKPVLVNKKIRTYSVLMKNTVYLIVIYIYMYIMYESLKQGKILFLTLHCMVTTNLQEIFTQFFKRDCLSGPCGFISKKRE